MTAEEQLLKLLKDKGPDYVSGYLDGLIATAMVLGARLKESVQNDTK